jgi:hypothetical protein
MVFGPTTGARPSRHPDGLMEPLGSLDTPVPCAGALYEVLAAGNGSTQQAQAMPVGAVSGSDGRRVMPSDVSTGNPSRDQYSNPPIISLTG